MKKHTREQVEATANAIMKHFIPKNPDETSLSFHFTIPPASNYKVIYEKEKDMEWKFLSFEVDSSEK